jgi:hypothetical protein
VFHSPDIVLFVSPTLSLCSVSFFSLSLSIVCFPALGWQQAIASAKAELGYHNSKMIHLQLLKKYGKDAWTAHNEELNQVWRFSNRILTRPCIMAWRSTLSMEASVQSCSWTITLVGSDTNDSRSSLSF